MFENPYFWIVLVVAIAVAVPVIGQMIRKRDFKDQVTGKKPERKLKMDPSAYSNQQRETNNEIELLKLDIQQKTKDNLSGL